MRTRISILGILFLSLGLQQSNLDYLRPQSGDPDAVIVSNAIAFEQQGQGYLANTRPPGFYPYLLSDVLHWLPGNLQSSAKAGLDLDQHLERARHQGVLGRRLIGLCGMLSVLLTFLIARRLMDSAWALASSAAVSLSFFMVFFGRMARPHAAVAAMALFAVWTLVRLVEQPRHARAWQAGLGIGLCIGVLHSGLPIVGTVLVAFLIMSRSSKQISGSQLMGIGLRMTMAAAPILLLAYRFLFWNSTEGKGASYKVGWHGAEVLGEALWLYDPFLLVASLLGLGFVLARGLALVRRGGLARQFSIGLLVASFPLGYFALFVPHTLVWHRHAVPLVPYVAMLGMYGMQQLGCLYGSAVLQKCVVGVCALGIGFAGYCSLQLVRLSGKPDTATLCAHWLSQQTHPVAREIAISPGCTLPIFMTLESIQETPPYLRSDWHRYLRRSELEPEGATDVHVIYPSKNQDAGLYGSAIESLLQREELDYIVLLSSDAHRKWAEPVRKVLRQVGGEVAIRFGALPGEGLHPQTGPTGLPGDDPLGWSLHSEVMGRALEVWRLPPGAGFGARDVQGPPPKKR